MSDDPIIEAAQQAAATPATEAPDVREQRRQAIMGEADYWKDGPKTAALRQEMKDLVLGSAPSPRSDLTRALMRHDLPAEERTEKSKELRADLNEEHRAKLTRELLDPRLSASDRAEKMRELRETLGRLETDDEKSAPQSTDPRERYSMKDPALYRNNREWLAAYDADFRTYETDLADVAHAHGFDAPLVRNLRDAAIELGQHVVDTGKPVTNEELAREFDRLRVPAKSRPALTQLWRQIEGK